MSTSMKRRSAAAVAAAILATLVVAAPAAQAADPKTDFPRRLTYGASYAAGSIRWHARSVDIDYGIKAYGCFTLYAETHARLGGFLGSGESKVVCDGNGVGTLNVKADTPGGAGIVVLEFYQLGPGTRDELEVSHP